MRTVLIASWGSLSNIKKALDFLMSPRLRRDEVNWDHAIHTREADDTSDIVTLLIYQ